MLAYCCDLLKLHAKLGVSSGSFGQNDRPEQNGWSLTDSARNLRYRHHMKKKQSKYHRGYSPLLTDRERSILHLVVRNFIDTAGPVGSRKLARKSSLGLSPATVRNTLSDLQELGYLRHPHRSAGRMPTELGYRAFVNELMETPELSTQERQLLKDRLDRLMGDADTLFQETSRLLGRMSNLLGVVLSPKISTGVLERLDVILLSEANVMIVISVKSLLVKTIVYETNMEIRREDLDRIVSILNERLAGLRLEEIRRDYVARTNDLGHDPTGIVQLILNESAVLFSDPVKGRLTHSGTRGLLAQPEFQSTSEMRQIIDLIENEGYVVQLFDQAPGCQLDTDHWVSVGIGSEIQDETVSPYSIISARYSVGQSTGTVGLLGPMRMDYGRAISLVETMASLLDRPAITGSRQ